MSVLKDVLAFTKGLFLYGWLESHSALDKEVRDPFCYLVLYGAGPQLENGVTSACPTLPRELAALAKNLSQPWPATLRCEP